MLALTWLGPVLALAWLGPRLALAQAPLEGSEPAVIPALGPLPRDAIEPPRLIGEATVEYPPSASGDHEVVLELLVTREGNVTEARAVQGNPPFASAAESAALRFRFEPARRAGVATAAKIRIVVGFTDPTSIPEPTATPEAEQPPAPVAPAVVTVLGARDEPLAHSLSRAEVRQLPGAFGDPFRAIEALPGVTPMLSGVPFFYVRGAPPGNVGYFLDGIRLPLLYHVGLGPSVVHPAMVSRVDLYPGAYPTRYGRFSGGIVAGELTEPPDSWRGEWQLRIFDAGAMVEAPIFGGKGHVLAGGRYSYTAYLISLLGEDARLEYWDYQLRASYDLTPDDTLGVFFFGSFDYFGEDTEASDDQLLSTEFHRVDLRHRHSFASEASLITSLTLGYDRTRVTEDAGAAINRRVQLRSAFKQELLPELELELGADVAFDRYEIDFDFEEDEDIIDLDEDSRRQRDEDEALFRRLFPGRRDTVTGGYAELRWDADRTTRLTSGVRFDAYASSGAAAYSIEPRLSAEFRITPELSLNNALGLAAQPPSFVLPVAGFEIGGLPGGLQRSVQSSAGAEYRLPDGMKLELNLFHNAFFNMTDAFSLVRVEMPEDAEDLQPDSRTRGQAYGLELMFHRDLTRKLGGFLSYTLSRSIRSSFRGTIPASFDRTHVLNAVLAYDLGRSWRAGGRFVFYTGNPQFEIATELPRLPPYHRLDLRLEKRWRIGSSGAYGAFVIEVLNSTLSTEVIARDCVDGVCRDEAIGPITIPSLSFEGRF